jgi:hypothetical protein
MCLRLSMDVVCNCNVKLNIEEMKHAYSLFSSLFDFFSFELLAVFSSQHYSSSAAFWQLIFALDKKASYTPSEVKYAWEWCAKGLL